MEGGHGTGFLWLAGDTLYLITTWHNVTVWDPVRDRALDEKKAFGPDCVQFEIGLEKDAGEEADRS